MKIQLKSLRVVNCGPLRDVCIDFTDEVTGQPRPTTLLAGANGSGKTTVLELIVALAEMINPKYSFGFYDGKVEHGLPSDELNGSRFNVLKRAAYAQADWVVDDEVMSVYCGEPPSSAVLADNYVGRPALDLGTWSDNERRKGEVVEKLRRAIYQQERDKAAVELSEDDQAQDISSVPSVLLFPHYRSLVPLTGKQLQREEAEYQWVCRYKVAEEFEGSLSSYLIWLDYAEPEVFARVIKFLNGLGFDGKTFGVVRRKLKAVVTTKDGQVHDVAELSSGEQNSPYPAFGTAPPPAAHSIVLIDEIENSLHPAFQQRIGQALKRLQREEPFQLIATSHAPAFLEIFRTGEHVDPNGVLNGSCRPSSAAGA